MVQPIARRERRAGAADCGLTSGDVRDRRSDSADSFYVLYKPQAPL